MYKFYFTVNAFQRILGTIIVLSGKGFNLEKLENACDWHKIML